MHLLDTYLLDARHLVKEVTLAYTRTLIYSIVSCTVYRKQLEVDWLTCSAGWLHLSSSTRRVLSSVTTTFVLATTIHLVDSLSITEAWFVVLISFARISVILCWPAVDLVVDCWLLTRCWANAAAPIDVEMRKSVSIKTSSAMEYTCNVMRVRVTRRQRRRREWVWKIRWGWELYYDITKHQT